MAMHATHRAAMVQRLRGGARRILNGGTMRMTPRKTSLFVTAAAVIGSTAVAMAIGGAHGTVHIDSSVPSANPRVGSPANTIADGFALTRLALGTDPLENPSGVITAFGFLATGTKTEAD